MSDYMICPMKESDLDQVLEIESRSFPLPWSRTHFLDELASTHSFPLVAIDPEEQILGYICSMLLLDEGHILDVAVRPEARGQGIGRALVERVVRECGEQGAAFVALEVRPSNTTAVALYVSMGFQVTGRRKRYYSDGEDALLMEYLFSRKRTENAV